MNRSLVDKLLKFSCLFFGSLALISFGLSMQALLDHNFIDMLSGLKCLLIFTALFLCGRYCKEIGNWLNNLPNK